MPHLNISAMVVLNRIKQAGLPEPVQEYCFCPGRKWRFDFCYPDRLSLMENCGLYKVAIEFEGGIWIQGRHSRGAGMLKDMEKYNTATIMGWKVLRYCSNNVDDMVPDLKKILQ